MRKQDILCWDYNVYLLALIFSMLLFNLDFVTIASNTNFLMISFSDFGAGFCENWIFFVGFTMMTVSINICQYSEEVFGLSPIQIL